MRSALLLLTLLVTACTSSEKSPDPDGGVDAGRDSGAAVDAGHDATTPGDAGYDAGQTPDAGQDAGPTCVCASGACCDGCNLRPSIYACAVDAVEYTTCVGQSVCPAYGLTFRTRRGDRHCSGSSTACDGLWMNTHSVDVDCDSSQGFPMYARCVDPAAAEAYCAHGPNCTTESP
jgi:hypothetical protein